MLFSSSRQLLAVLAVLTVGLFLWQTQWGLWSDVVFYIASAERVLAGGELYLDIIDMNPPLAFLIVLPPVKFAQMLSLDSLTVYRFGIFAMIWGSCCVSWLILRCGNDRREIVLATIFALFLIVVIPAGPAFGQREHLSLILILPYLVMSAGRVQGTRFPLWLAIVVGLSAGMGFGLKPFFLLPLVFSELGMMWLRRRVFAVMRTEAVVIGLFLCVYLASAWIFYPKYFEIIVPLARATYLLFNLPWMEILASGEVYIALILIVLVGILVLKRQKELALPMLMTLAALGFLAAYIAQRKGFYYHIYPSYALTSAALLLSIPIVVPSVRDSLLRGILMVGLVVMPFAVTHYYWMNYVREQHALDAALLAEIEPTQSIAIYTHDIGQTFPFLRRNNKEWASSFPAFWPLLETSRKLKLKLPLSEADQSALAFVRGKVVDDLEKYQPDLVLIEQRQGTPVRAEYQVPYLDLFSTDARFVQQWTHYQLEKNVHFFEVWRRIEDGAN